VDLPGHKGTKKIIEWDIWEDKTMKKSIVWTSCASTVLFPCSFNLTAFENYYFAPTFIVVNDGVTLKKKKKKTEPVAGFGARIMAFATGAVNGTKKYAKKAFGLEDEAEFKSKSFDFYDDFILDLAHGRGLLGSSLDQLGHGLASTVGSLGKSIYCQPNIVNN
jgi:hypothetical protein